MRDRGRVPVPKVGRGEGLKEKIDDIVREVKERLPEIVISVILSAAVSIITYFWLMAVYGR